MSQIKRCNFYIKKEFQRRFILHFCMLVVLACIFFGALIYVFSGTSVTTSFEQSRLVLKHTSDFVLPLLGLSSCIIIAAIGLAVIYVVKRISHQIAGPVYRIEMQLKKIAQGNLAETVTLRQTDELQELAVCLNDTIKSLQTGIREAKTQAEAALSAASGQSPAVRDPLQKLCESLNRFTV